jgi:hypothetical protein
MCVEDSTLCVEDYVHIIVMKSELEWLIFLMNDECWLKFMTFNTVWRRIQNFEVLKCESIFRYLL